MGGGIGLEVVFGEVGNAERDGVVTACYPLAAGAGACASALFFGFVIHGVCDVFCNFAVKTQRREGAQAPLPVWRQRLISKLTLTFQILTEINNLIRLWVFISPTLFKVFGFSFCSLRTLQRYVFYLKYASDNQTIF